MTDTDSIDVRTYECPSPDDCPFETDDIDAFLEHVNSKHVGEYQREDWPDTPAGQSVGGDDSANEQAPEDVDE